MHWWKYNEIYSWYARSKPQYPWWRCQKMRCFCWDVHLHSPIHFIFWVVVTAPSPYLRGSLIQDQPQGCWSHRKYRPGGLCEVWQVVHGDSWWLTHGGCHMMPLSAVFIYWFTSGFTANARWEILNASRHGRASPECRHGRVRLGTQCSTVAPKCQLWGFSWRNKTQDGNTWHRNDNSFVWNLHYETMSLTSFWGA